MNIELLEPKELGAIAAVFFRRANGGLTARVLSGPGTRSVLFRTPNGGSTNQLTGVSLKEARSFIDRVNDAPGRDGQLVADDEAGAVIEFKIPRSSTVKIDPPGQLLADSRQTPFGGVPVPPEHGWHWLRRRKTAR
jgi:hypothetical protein